MNIYDLTYKQLEDYFINNKEAKFKATQVFDWLYKKEITSFDDMKNIKKSVIEKLKEDFTLNLLKIVTEKNDKDVSKFLFNLEDDLKIEAVLMKHNYGLSLCISTEVGCNMGCAFCESGKLKRRRALRTYEMLLQVITVERKINKRIDSIVLMGIGEPFNNFDNVINFIDIITCNKGMDKSMRKITVSTSGIVPKIKEFAQRKMGVNLAISLHASNDEVRSLIMPVNKVYNIKELISSIKYYLGVAGRRVTIEYVLLDNINDKKVHAKELSNLLKGLNVYVNLIPYNETSGIFKRSKKENVLNFYDILKKNNIDVTIRREFGSNIDAACGQLSSKY
ncbi:MAG: 23S rRNA (adenine(2503)-C(2))-methyltransferase RlmN [Bacilli bacterium]